MHAKETGQVQIIEAFEAPFTEEEAQWLKVDHGEASSQAVCGRVRTHHQMFQTLSGGFSSW